MSDRFLATPLRRALERDVKKAREIAEAGVTAAIERLGVAEPSVPPHMANDEDAKAARRRLRVHARALGDAKTADGGQTVDRLVEAAAYAQWHRRLFARFLAERNLLRHPEHGVPVTLEEAEELAVEEDYPDGWSAAEAYAAKMLPAVFQPDDPVLALRLAPEHEQALRKLVLGLDAETFQADDALGWTYQFWRALEKDRVNKAGGKIGARELPAVTQLFTEPYMVKFLLHNTLGAWRASRVLEARPDLAASAADEAALRTAVSPPGYEFDMLRFVREGEDGPWRLAAGTFPGWPRAAAEIRVLDPCCGSGHFLTEMLAILAALRADEEGMSQAQAVAAVLGENLFGLELDGRCVQIAAFAVALTAWRIGGFQPFGADQVHIAWVGAPPPLDRAEFEALGNGDGELRYALGHLHDLFRQAPALGSLLEPTGGDLLGPRVMGKLDASLPTLVAHTRSAEPERAEGAVAARGMADALALLGRRYTLIATNVPFLGRGRQVDVLKTWIDRNDSDAKADLATAMLSRTMRLLAPGGTTAAVTPQNWLFLGGYKHLRARLLQRTTLNILGALGSRAFETITGEVVNTALVVLSAIAPKESSVFGGIDANDYQNATEKRAGIEVDLPRILNQSAQLRNPDHVITTSSLSDGPRLSEYADCVQGIGSGDLPRYLRYFTELPSRSVEWDFFQTTPEGAAFSGYTSVIHWQQGRGPLAAIGTARKGLGIVGKIGISVRVTATPTPAFFLGSRFDCTLGVLVPKRSDYLPAVAALAFDPGFGEQVRRMDQAFSITESSFLKVPFDLAYWAKVAAERYPDGLPEPYSDDPTQWLFHGHPSRAERGTQLHTALARFAGYRWPAETDAEMRLSAQARDLIAKAADLPPPDADGLLPLVAVGSDRPLADRLRDYLNIAIPGWDEARLIREADERIDNRAGKDLSLEGWLRDRAFRQHCTLFHNRPFLWQVWDGQRDGFSAFLHYHRLDHAALQKLTYTLLGAWIARREAEKDERRVEAARVLKQKLEAILEGDKPYDIFVRWKPLEHQPVGWNPDVDDGVRLNIRPWVEASVLREPAPKGIKWGVDRGKDVASAPWFPHDRGERNNDRHTTLAEKKAAREAASRKVGAA